MAKVLISLVGGRPLPNVLVVLHFQPKYLYFIVSQDSESDYEKTLNALPESLKTNARKKVVSPYLLEETIKVCKEMVQDHPDDEVILHVTSGPKTMAFGAYDVAKEKKDGQKKEKKDGQKIEVYYLARPGLISLFESKEPESVEISLDEYFASYGWEIQCKNNVVEPRFEQLVSLFVENLPISHELICEIRGVCKGKGKRTCTLKKRLEDEKYELLEKIETLEMISNLKRTDNDTQWTLNSQEDADFLLTGNWLEYHVYKVAQSLTNKGQALFHECRWGVEERSDGKQKGEIDFAGISGGQIVIASCKTEKSLERKWFEELHSKAQQLGKGMCSSLMISTVSRRDRGSKQIEDYNKWAGERQITLVLAEDIQKLDSILKKVVSGNRDDEPKEICCYPRI